MQITDPFTINTFGFGSDHDPLLMTEIAKLKDGNFDFIENLKEIEKMFVNILAGLFSVVA